MIIKEAKHRSTPSLSESTYLRYFNFIALYFAQGVPEGMLLFGIPAWMAMNEKTPGEIGAFAVAAGLPWSFKFIVAPMMDRYTYLPMGRKRPWVLIGQLGLILSCMVMAFIPDPLNNLNQLMMAGFLVSCCGAFQDVATDGMAVDIIPVEEQARANGFMWGSKIIGISASLALGSWLLNAYNFTVAILMLSVMISVIMLIPLFLTERKGEKILPWTSGAASSETREMQLTSWKVIFRSLFKVFRLRNSILLTIVLFITQGAYNYMSTLLPIFTVKELGWTNISYSQYYSTAKLIGGMVGMVLGGFLIDRYGKRRMMSIYLLLMAITTAAFAYSKISWTIPGFIYGYMIIYNVLITFASIGIFAMAMQCCWKKVSASQFTLYMTISNLGRIAFAALIGPLKEAFSWQNTVFAFAIMAATAAFLLQFLNINKHMERVDDLENKDAKSKVLEMAAN